MGRITQLEPGLKRLVAPNPSPMTERGTNTYILGTGPILVIDPGPDDPAHLEAILAAVGDAPVRRILVTHTHLDHSALAPRLAARTGAPVAAFGDYRAGRSPAMEGLDGLDGGEGLDRDFVPDEVLADGAVLDAHPGRVEAMWTPGHLGNHLTFLWNGAAFCGDLVMGWATSLVSPPDGDLTRFMTSCRALAARAPRVLYPGHGAPVTAPADRIAWLLAHRDTREAQILAALNAGPLTPREIAGRLYADVDPHLLPAAERNVLAHLIDLSARDRVRSPTAPSSTAPYDLP